MALSANANVEFKEQPLVMRYEVASGALVIYRGAILNFNTSGYVKLGADTASETFAGIALEYLSQASGGSNGDNKIEVAAFKSGRVVKLTTTGTITRANIGDVVYADGDDAVDLAAGVTNNIAVGTIVGFIDANTAWVKLDQ